MCRAALIGGIFLILIETCSMILVGKLLWEDIEVIGNLLLLLSILFLPSLHFFIELMHSLRIESVIHHLLLDINISAWFLSEILNARRVYGIILHSNKFKLGRLFVYTKTWVLLICQSLANIVFIVQFWLVVSQLFGIFDSRSFIRAECIYISTLHFIFFNAMFRLICNVKTSCSNRR